MVEKTVTQKEIESSLRRLKSLSDNYFEPNPAGIRRAVQSDMEYINKKLKGIIDHLFYRSN